MPSKGGAAGKAGDQYEALWIVDAALRVVQGIAEQVTYEALDPELSRGVEFNVRTSEGEVEFWSLKRQTSAASGWTLALLVRPDEGGRSILGDLMVHIERDVRNVAVFASSLGAARLEELRCAAVTAEILQQRLEQSKELNGDYRKYLLPQFNGDEARALQFLQRLRIRTADETTLRINIESTIELLFYREAGGADDAAEVRRLLEEYLLDHMHQAIDQGMLLTHLQTHGIRRKDWKLDSAVRERVQAICEAYTRTARSQLIGGLLQRLPGAEGLLSPNGLPASRRSLVAGCAGGGKSALSAQVIEGCCKAGIAALPIQMDLVQSFLSPRQLGEALSLPASPVAVLAGLADGGDCVLVIDQLDAISFVSGRRVEVWSMFEQILMEADGYPNMRVVVACREFDLEHDHRMRALKTDSRAFAVIRLQAFEMATVEAILGDQKVHPKLKPLLAVPIQLAMFLSLSLDDRGALETRGQLFEAFWDAKQSRADQRLGRVCNMPSVVDRLSQWMSERQELSAPFPVIDEFRADANALTSENLLVFAAGRFRFFHETFFDYAFARRFASRGGSLLDLLLSTEQHLFRRAQVRQVLSFLRSTDLTRYNQELQSVLTDAQVRPHIKCVILQNLRAVPGPTEAEWRVLSGLMTANSELATQIKRAVSNHSGWFDILDSSGFLDSELASKQPHREELVIWLCGMPEVMRRCSQRVEALLSLHRRNDADWRLYLQHIFRGGEFYHSREMFSLILSLIHDGTLDGAGPKFSVNDSWWSSLSELSEKAPQMASEAIGAWFDRKLSIWRALPIPRDFEAGVSLRSLLEADGDDWEVIGNAAKAPLAFVELLLPRVAALVAELATPGNHLETDPLWSFRIFGDDARSVPDSILFHLAAALEALALQDTAELDRLLEPYVQRPQDTITYLILRAWSAVPETYAEQMARYLAEDARRLRVGYGAGKGTFQDYRSREAIRCASPLCSLSGFETLERIILELQDDWETQNPKSRGFTQLGLLSAMAPDRLGTAGRSKLAELQRKFPSVGQEAPRKFEAGFVGPPIPAKAQEKMTNDHWLSAMEKYAGVEHKDELDFLSGGEFELGGSLQSRTKQDPQRFLALAAQMPTSLPHSYFDSILAGLADTSPPVDGGAGSLVLPDVIAVLDKVHTLPEKPCGRSIVHLVGTWCQVDWPADVLEMVAWYATEDPDPKEEAWNKESANGQPYYGGDPEMAGLNSTRGAAARAIGQLLLAKRERDSFLEQAVNRLAHDSSVAVRSQAIHPLLALLNTRAEQAVKWFVECVAADPILLKTRLVEHFLNYAGCRDYGAVRPVIQAMISTDDPATIEAGSRLCCLLALRPEAPPEDAESVCKGTPLMRRAAATVYASHIAHKEVGATCRERLLPFFADEDLTVRSQAAKAFRQIKSLQTPEQGRLLKVFLDSQPNAEALEPVILAMADSPVRLPDLICDLVEAGLKVFKADAGDIRTHGALIARHLSTIVVRLYTQSEDEAIRKRCLDAIDEMESANFYRLSDELERLDR